jgi:hypothetical protein
MLVAIRRRFGCPARCRSPADPAETAATAAALGAAGAGLAIVYLRPPHMPAVLELLASAPSELSWAGTRGTCVIDLSEPSLGVAATGARQVRFSPR